MLNEGFLQLVTDSIAFAAGKAAAKLSALTGHSYTLQVCWFTFLTVGKSMVPIADVLADKCYK